MLKIKPQEIKNKEVVQKDNVFLLRQKIIYFGKKASVEDLKKFYEIYLVLEESKKKCKQ